VHNVTNTLGAIAVAELFHLPKSSVIQAISEFRGVRRRFEHIGDAAGVRVMDDYAHHPTEIESTLTAARERFPARRIVCLFQPHTYSRTAYLIDGFRKCFRQCDALFICETYAAREEPSAGMSAEQLAMEVLVPRATYAGSLEESARIVAHELREGDVFFTVGAGDVEKVAPMVLEMLQGR
jgi:UDP-N-acetylmuramate--alanine ligase